MNKETIYKRAVSINKSLYAYGMHMWSHSDSIDENLYKEDIEIIRLEYDRAGKMLDGSNTSFLGSVALAVAIYSNSKCWFRFFVIMSIWSLIWAYYWNVKMNKTLNTLRKRLKEQSK